MSDEADIYEMTRKQLGQGGVPTPISAKELNEKLHEALITGDPNHPAMPMICAALVAKREVSKVADEIISECKDEKQRACVRMTLASLAFAFQLAIISKGAEGFVANFDLCKATIFSAGLAFLEDTEKMTSEYKEPGVTRS